MFEEIDRKEEKNFNQSEGKFEGKKESKEIPDEEFISVMPERFREGKIEYVKKKKREISKEIKKEKPITKKTKFGLTIFLVLIIIVGAGIGFYFWLKSYLGPTPVLKRPKEKTPVITRKEETIPERKLSAEVRNKENKLLSQATLYFPKNSLEEKVVVDFKGEMPQNLPTSTYDIIGGIYKIGPDIPIVSKPVSISIKYNKDIVNLDQEKNLKIGYFKDDLWTILPTSLDTSIQTASTTLNIIPADTFALIVKKTKKEKQKFKIAPQISSSQDTDKDGLTDVEEQIYQTGINNPDTDNDGFLDGAEISNLNNPLVSDQKLALSNLIKVYTNKKWNYSIFYPAMWVVKPLPETDETQVMIVTNTGEFFEVSVTENPDKLSIKDWYAQQSPDIDISEAELTNIAGYPAIWSPDKLNLYILKNNNVYILTYNLGTEKEANFKTTFQMMIKSFNFLEKKTYTGNRPDGTLIKYASSTTVYLIEDGKKRPIYSEEVYERLGYKKWKVITIPDDETYPTGEMIK